MVKRRDCVIGASVAYLFLLMLFFIVKDKVVFNTVCFHESPCVRFCCNDPKTCTTKFIRSNFNESLLPKFIFSGQVDRDLKVLYGAPHCSLEPLSDEQVWQFNEVSPNYLYGLEKFFTMVFSTDPSSWNKVELVNMWTISTMISTVCKIGKKTTVTSPNGIFSSAKTTLRCSAICTTCVS